MAKITRFPYTPVCPGCHHPDRIDPIAEEGTMAHDKVADEEPAELVRRAAEAHVRGDMRAYFAPIRYGDDNTPMSPFGGEPTRGPEDPPPGRPEASVGASLPGRRGGAGTGGSYASGDLAVLVASERQRGRVGGLPEQDRSLRVTWVFRRGGSEWRQAHRHADPLVLGIDLEQPSALARG